MIGRQLRKSRTGQQREPAFVPSWPERSSAVKSHYPDIWRRSLLSAGDWIVPPASLTHTHTHSGGVYFVLEDGISAQIRRRLSYEVIFGSVLFALMTKFKLHDQHVWVLLVGCVQMFGWRVQRWMLGGERLLLHRGWLVVE